MGSIADRHYPDSVIAEDAAAMWLAQADLGAFKAKPFDCAHQLGVMRQGASQAVRVRVENPWTISGWQRAFEKAVARLKA